MQCSVLVKWFETAFLSTYLVFFLTQIVFKKRQKDLGSMHVHVRVNCLYSISNQGVVVTASSENMFSMIMSELLKGF